MKKAAYAVTHGLCGKEGAMVFKKVLKGFGRLMLTTGLLCGVGLFLCGSDVWAATTAAVSMDGDNIKVVLTDDTTAFSSTEGISSVKLYYDSTNYIEINTTGTLISEDKVCTATISKSDYITAAKAKMTALSSLSISKAEVGFSGGSGTSPVDATGATNIKTVYKVTATYRHAYGEKTLTPNYSITYNGNTTSPATRAEEFMYAGESYSVISDVDSTKYHENNMDNGKTGEYGGLPAWDSTSSSTWKDPTGYSWTFTSNSDTSKNNKEFVYLPKVQSISFDPNDSSPIVVVNDNSITFDAYVKLTAVAVDADSNNTSAIISNMLCENSSCDITNIKGIGGKNSFEWGTNSDREPNNFKIHGTIEKASTAGLADIKFTVEGKSTTTKKLFVYYKKPVISIMSTSPLTVAKDDFEPYEITISPTIPDDTTLDSILGNIKIAASKTSTSASRTYTANSYFDASVTSVGTLVLEGKKTTTTNQSAYLLSDDARLGASDTDRIVKQFTVKVTEAAATIDADYTKKAINSSDRNYITYNDKKYKLDIAQLVIDNLRDDSNKSIKSSYKVSQVSDIEVDDSTTNIVDDRYWQPSSTTTGKTFTCNVAGTAITGTVMAYPMPTATYNSDRTLSLKIPTKVSTAYSDSSTNIRKSKGFKLSLEDSSGNTLYSYDDSKYKSVLSSSDEQTVSYTVSASDVENLVTSAASNGKFSSDTTSVKFKIVPMGYKQSSSSDDTIKADGDRIYAKTDTTSVYKVSVTGNYFNSTSTYGLNGQTVTLTATPNSGYTFKQWSDGNTSNPRSITVSSSGTRTYQAVAGEKTANGTNGSGTGTDNSSLYDDVPKTAESNSAIWLIIFMVFAVMGTTYALYLQLRAASSKNDK